MISLDFIRDNRWWLLFSAWCFYMGIALTSGAYQRSIKREASARHEVEACTTFLESARLQARLTAVMVGVRFGRSVKVVAR